MNHRNILRQVPLIGLFSSFLLIIILPPMGIGLATYMIDTITLRRIEQIQNFIQDIDESINAGSVTIGAISAIPCNLEPCYVKQEYYQSNILIANDTFVQEELNRYRLLKREYYENNKVVAEDIFEQSENNSELLKQRRYYNSNELIFLQEEFTQSGIGHPKEYLTTKGDYQLKRNSMRSPFPPPPLFFVYFYR